jgi:hypothetical protein
MTYAQRQRINEKIRKHQIDAYGAPVVNAHFKGHCGCGRITAGPYGLGTQVCPFFSGDRIVRFRGAWWNVSCVDRIQLEEFHATCRFVLEVQTRDGSWKPIEWSLHEESARYWQGDIDANDQWSGMPARVIDRTRMTGQKTSEK